MPLCKLPSLLLWLFMVSPNPLEKKKSVFNGNLLFMVPFIHSYLNHQPFKIGVFPVQHVVSGWPWASHWRNLTLHFIVCKTKDLPTEPAGLEKGQALEGIFDFPGNRFWGGELHAGSLSLEEKREYSQEKPHEGGGEARLDREREWTMN